MERNDIDGELSMPGAQELLTSTSAAHLAYIGKDGTPRVVPVGFFLASATDPSRRPNICGLSATVP